MERTTFWRDQRWAVIGFLCTIPALLLVTSGLAQSLLGWSHLNQALNFEWVIFHPAVILGGLGVGLLLNVWAVAHISFQRQTGAWVSTVTIQPRWFSLGLIGVVFALGGVIFLYLLAENFQIFARVAGG